MALTARRWSPAEGLWQVILGAADHGDAPQKRAAPAIDIRLLSLVRSGDAVAQEAYVGAMWPEVERNAAYYASRGGSREELEAEGALALWEAVFAYDRRRHRSDPEGYVRSRIHRRVRKAYREAIGYAPGALKVVPLLVEAPPAAVEEGFSEIEARLDLERAISRLPERDGRVLRDYLALRAEGGVGPEEAVRRIAAGAGRSKDAVKKQVQRSRNRISAHLPY